MKGQVFGIGIGCVVWVLLPLFVLGAWRFVRGQGWGYSRLGWSLAARDCRESMARDYLATRNVIGMGLDQLRADLGEESTFRERWTYAVGEHESVVFNGWTYWFRRPELELQFNRLGELRSLETRWLYEGPVSPFSADLWRETSGAARASMARDLVERQLFLGARRDGLRPLLGDPDRSEMSVDYRVSDASSDGVYLEASLNLDGLVIDAEVTRQ